MCRQTVAAAVKNLRNRSRRDASATVHGNHVDPGSGRRRQAATSGILAVTVLTSLDRGDLDRRSAFDCDVEQLVLSRAERALGAGLRRASSPPASRRPAAARVTWMIA
jgi:orotidine-5'-phosphate decarboxylase